MKYILFSLLFASCASQSTDVVIINDSEKDSVKVFVTLQSTESVEGLWGITTPDPSCQCKGSFWAKKGVPYHLNRTTEVSGAIVTFEGDNQSCQAAISNGFPNGLNNFEFTVNTPYEAMDISCVDGVNSIIEVNCPNSWGVTSYSNKKPLSANLNLPGVFPYGCTVCDSANNPPSLCWGYPTKCSNGVPCQFNRNNNNGGVITVKYK